MKNSKKKIKNQAGFLKTLKLSVTLALAEIFENLKKKKTLAVGVTAALATIPTVLVACVPTDKGQEGEEENKGGENQEKPNEGEQSPSGENQDQNTPSGDKEEEKKPDEEKKPTGQQKPEQPEVKYPTSIAELNKSENAEYKNHLVEYFDDVFKETLIKYSTGGEATVQNTTSLAYDLDIDNNTITGFFKMENEEKKEKEYFITSGKIKGEISLEKILKYQETNKNNPNLSVDKLSVSTSYSLVMAAKQNNYQEHAKQAYEFLTETTLEEANYFAEIVGTGTALGGNHATFRTVAMYEKEGKIYIHAITTQVKNDRYNELGVADDVEIYEESDTIKIFGNENTIILMTFENQNEKEMQE